jgi:hypothetical protein
LSLTDWQVVPISAENATAIPEFLYRIFGYSLTDTRLYDSAQVLQHYHGFVCLASSGSVHGLLLLAFSFPTRRILEIAELLIDPDTGESAAGHVLKGFIAALRGELTALRDQHGLRCAVTLEVTEHQLTQRLSQQMGMVTAGVYLGYVPGWQRQLRTRPQERTAARQPSAGASGRRTMVVSARPIRTQTPPQRFAPPDRFEALIREIYTDFRLAAEYVPPSRRTGPGMVETRLDFVRGIAILLVHEAGDDTPRVLLERLQHYRNGFVELIHIVLPLSLDDINPAVECLIEAGCSFASVLPQYAESPVVVMQSIQRESLAPIPQGVFSPRASRILSDIL